MISIRLLHVLALFHGATSQGAGDIVFTISKPDGWEESGPTLGMIDPREDAQHEVSVEFNAIEVNTTTSVVHAQTNSTFHGQECVLADFDGYELDVWVKHAGSLWPCYAREGGRDLRIENYSATDRSYKVDANYTTNRAGEFYFLCSLEEVTSPMSTSCAGVNDFYERCLKPVVGVQYGARRFDMDVVCQALFWGVDIGSTAFEGNNCSVRGLEVVSTLVSTFNNINNNVGSSQLSLLLDSCELPTRSANVAIQDFVKTCESRAGTSPPLEDSSAWRGLRPEELWAAAAQTKQRQEEEDKAASLSPNLTHQQTGGQQSGRQQALSSSSLRSAMVSEVQQGPRDPVHTVWINGPTYSGKLRRNPGASASWPEFEEDESSNPNDGDVVVVSGTTCDATQDRYTGYSSTAYRSAYCFPSSRALDNDAHLLISSGWGAIVLDAAMEDGNIVPKLGTVSDDLAGGAWQAIYDSLPAAQLNVTLETTSGKFYRLVKSLDFAVVSPVREGVNLAHVTATMMSWKGSGVNVTNIDPPQWWLEFNVWANSASIQLGWDELDVDGQGCAVCEEAEVTMSLAYDGKVVITSAKFTPGEQFVPNGLSVFVEFPDDGGKSGSHSVAVSSSDGTIANRSETNDFVLEVQPSAPTCAYGSVCSPLVKVAFTASNYDTTEDGVLRLAVTRNYPSRSELIDAADSSQVGAEITGLSVLLRDQDENPTGIPLQISKKWDETSTKQVYESRYDLTPAGGNSWWTVVLFLRIPAGSQIDLTLVLAYNQYGGVPSFSHAQLSLIGYTDSWVWHQTSLGSLGENLCIDTLSVHARSQQTDLRVELFDGNWAQNVGGGDLLVYFNAAGSFVYAKALDASILANGPCLSNASYTSISADNKIGMSTHFSGGRNNEFVKTFYHVRYDIFEATAFSRLALFQVAADLYQMDSPASFQFGNANTTNEVPTNCTASSFEYPSGYPYRQALPAGDSPWYFALKAQAVDESGWGDRGLVLRSYDAVLGGLPQPNPAFSVFCGNLELSVPAQVGNTLYPGDFVDMHLELVVLPRVETVTAAAAGASDFEQAIENTESDTLESLEPLSTTAAMVAALAQTNLEVKADVGVVESHYPVRVCVSPDVTGLNDTISFQVSGSMLGFVPIVLCGLSSHTMSADNNEGLWMKSSNGPEFVRVNQAVYDGTDFWQTNFSPSTGKYEIVFNLELPNSNVTEFSWPVAPAAGDGG